MAGDLRSVEQPAQLAAAVAERWGALDILFNNAGVQVDGAARGLADGTAAALAESLDVNLMAPYRLSLALLPLLRRGREPRIINVSSGAGTFQAMRQSVFTGTNPSLSRRCDISGMWAAP